MDNNFNDAMEVYIVITGTAVAVETAVATRISQGYSIVGPIQARSTTGYVVTMVRRDQRGRSLDINPA